MTNFRECMHQSFRIEDHRDKISSSLFHIHRILTTYFPDIDISSVNKMIKLLDSDFKTEILDNLAKFSNKHYL